MSHLSQRYNLQIEIREFLKLAVPLASAQVAQSATGFADTIMMGRMGPEILAAGGLASIIFISIMTMASGVVMGISPLVAEAFGAGQKKRIEQVARQGLWLGLLVAIPLTIATGNLETILARSGQTETTVKLVRTYLDIMSWGLFPAIGFAALRAIVAALSQARPVMIIMVLGTALNVTGNYILGFGKLGFPRLELAGLALSSTLALWGMFLALAIYVFVHPKLKCYRIFQKLHHIRLQVLKEVAWVGIPIGLFSGLEAGFFLVMMFWMGTLGTDALAAHQVVFQTLMVVFMVPLGISYATTVRVGQWLGQRDRTGIQQAAWVSVSVTALFMLGVSIAFLLFPKQIIGIYLDVQNPENAVVFETALPLLTIAAIAQVLDGVQKAVYGSLQGLQDTQIPMLTNVLGYWGVGLSVGYGLAFYFKLGSIGLWLGQAVAVTVVAGLFIWRFQKLLSNLMFHHLNERDGRISKL
ncbi:MATE family efflux transporter [Baaleninema simplex]|uniref:MATE family efflux transporter n=1 Tax=Baaleninema simplex TaxID=2862350 RepID=UPI000349EF43|nr:MATE family efflux transporter [Baaleninema simplex]